MDKNIETICKAFENIGDAIANFNMTNKPKDSKQLKYEELCKVLTAQRQNTKRIRYAAYGVELEYIANALQVKIQDVYDFEKWQRYDFKILTYYYYKMVAIYGLEYMEKTTEMYNEYMNMELGFAYDTYKKMTK